ncbi:ABC transporter permease [Metabacillus halosaccharovorans]|uniref:ABC transporter permease n=1 Tax=Metabacillus halosaccharovorans TaxID=930124 RepID=A0ABT3DNB5_9BACI|nr:FtsX-like permease family protein [Metabacillus halosaccharovorans]MCV9888554.1 ABC transporter permease [Metabacillus halosaccharovorans]
MALLKIIFQKMWNNKWLTCSLFLGLFITVSLVSSIPTYTSSVLHKLLVKELEQHQIDKNHFPGEFSYITTFEKDQNSVEATKKIADINKQIISNTDLPLLANKTILSSVPFDIFNENKTETDKHGRFVGLTDVEKHITITDGRMPAEKSEDGIIEVIVPETTLQKRGIVLNTPLIAVEGDLELTVKPVGTFQAENKNDPYWSIPPERYTDDFIVLEDTYREVFFKKELLSSARFFSAFDYYAIMNEHIPSLLQLKDKVKADVSDVVDTPVMVQFPISDILSSYEKKEEQLKTMLWSLHVPVLVMLALYLFMVSRLIVNRQLTEIAVLSSRGATRFQIMKIYLIELGILAGLAFLIGPYFGMLLCKILGGTNGFLQFVQREALPVSLGYESYLYAAVAVISSVFMVMIPVFQGSNQSIVHQKQNMTKAVTKTRWSILVLGLALIGISIYGLFVFNTRPPAVSQDYSVDPILFFIPALFVIGLGLLILHLYPLLLAGVYKLGKRYWNLSLYSTFIQVGRSFNQYQFLMLFLMMTIGIGIFSASAARTLNENFEQQIRYENGADVTIDVKWPSNEVAASTVSSSVTSGEQPTEQEGETSEENETLVTETQLVYSEPSFEPFLKMKEVEHAAKVLKFDGIRAEAKGKALFSFQVMGIEPKEFAQTAWFSPNLLPHHWYEYLNLLSQEQSSVLISRSVSKALGVKEGDYIKVEGDYTNTMEVVVYGIIDYWPSFLPEKKEEDEEAPALIVANLPYVQNAMGLEPYEVWLKVKKDASRKDLYQSLDETKDPIIMMSDVHPDLVELKNGAFLLGLNGTLSLGFIVSIIIAFIGFLLFWILTIKSRVLQYGVFRAMGIPLKKLIGILLFEQVLTSGFASFIGIIIGGITSVLFVPLFHLSMEQQLPFQVIFDPSDERKIYFFVALMLSVGLTILVLLVKKIKIYQAIKLGED